jgi:hypothetical protein
MFSYRVLLIRRSFPEIPTNRNFIDVYQTKPKILAPI